jgi:hypothetical protein
MTLHLQILQSHPYNKKSLKKHRSTWMFLNGRAKKNRLGEWCALESIVRYGIIDCLLTHMLNNLFRVCSYSWSHARKVWRVPVWRWWCLPPLSNVGSWWWPLSLATRSDQPTSPRASSRVPHSHHSSHPRFFTTVIYPLSQLLSCNSP